MSQEAEEQLTMEEEEWPKQQKNKQVTDRPERKKTFQERRIPLWTPTNRTEDRELIIAFSNKEAVDHVRKNSVDEVEGVNAWLEWIQEKMGEDKLEKSRMCT